ncbi:hypothetical protein MSAN_01257500 [Mycena sanguinolenta]|uniref:C3H1-type domain-containing protein n=1 Tax=Mycena sanguinolenta TaxID=230812 RepID=A0A8H6YHN2_9AGAR|nr:hypothetical protein MSAN_01257500 [Mycena sanguinolenta]
MPRGQKLCIFFQEGRCRYGENCHFLHSLEASSAPLSPPIDRVSSVTPLPSQSGNIWSWEADADLQLVQAINSLRPEAGQGSLDKTHKFFEILKVFCHLDEEDLESATDTLRLFASQEVDCDSQDDSDDRYGWEEEEIDFDALPKLFPPSKQITPDYVEPTFSAQQTANYPGNSYSFTNNLRQESFFDWDLLDSPSVVNVQFRVNFGIEDSHIAGFIARPAVCGRLLRFSAGDPNTGNGGGVRNEAAFVQFVRLCTNIRVFRLDAFTSLSDVTLLAIFEACPHIEMVQLSGHDKMRGRSERHCADGPRTGATFGAESQGVVPVRPERFLRVGASVVKSAADALDNQWGNAGQLDVRPTRGGSAWW